MTQPHFSIITTVYNGASHLPDFISSLDGQDFDMGRVEIIAVDDGSTDESSVLLADWARRRPELVTVLTQANAGQSAARNAGLARATGEWVTFPDPEDFLEPDYLAEVDGFMVRFPDAALLGTNRLLLHEATGEARDSHPLRDMFRPGNRVVDIDRYPRFWHNSAAAGFFRREQVVTANLRFDERIRPVTEDGHFCMSYLLACPARLVGYVRTANYVYRGRDGSSTLQRSLDDPDRYLAAPKHGYLDLLERTTEPGRPAPEWLQNMVLYDLSYYFSGDLSISSEEGPRGEIAEQFVATLRDVARLLEPTVVDSYDITRFDRLWLDILLHSLSGQTWHTPYAVIQNRDPGRGQVRLAYRFFGTPPRERFLAGGEPVEVLDGKVRTHVFFDQPLMYERVAWVTVDAAVRVELDGIAVPIRESWAPPYRSTTSATDIFEPAAPAPARKPSGMRARVVRTIAQSYPARRRYRNAWVFVDRVHEAGDNAEVLYRYVRRERPDINAWFLVERRTPDWSRLKRSGVRSRLVAYGSLRWKILLLNCAHLISSHADQPVHRPAEITAIDEPRWTFTFLQHGVIKDDLSRWLNPKHLDLFVTSTPQEQLSVAGDYTTYAHTSREARMTGLARFDRLQELGSQVPVENRPWLIVCPTWRRWLLPSAVPGTQRYVFDDSFFASDYIQQWTRFLSSERLADLAAKSGLRVGFLPHPNIQPALDQIHLPEHVETLTFAGRDIQRLVAETAVMVTDYSSMVFNGAYLNRPTVYFQFDAELMAGGAHVGRRGYFDYERDGFGPVTHTVDDALEAVERIVVHDGKVPAPAYQARIDQTFTMRDGHCCQRTVAAIEELPLRIRRERTLRNAARAARAELLERLRRSAAVRKFVRSDRGRRLVRRAKKLR